MIGKIDLFLRFEDYLRITGWVFEEGASLVTLETIDPTGRRVRATTGLASPDIEYGANLRWKISALMPEKLAISDLTFELNFTGGIKYAISGSDVEELLYYGFVGNEQDPHAAFFEAVNAVSSPAQVLEIGSRARSGVSRRSLFKQHRYVGFDILPGENVDIVGDVHDLSNFFKLQKFDFVYSVSTFEHLMMPWKAAIEINKVMKVGGIGLVSSHQSLGLHDFPNDYLRFSDTSWTSLFNGATGFEVLSARMTEPVIVVPAIYSKNWEGFESSRGFAGSSVAFRKTGESQVEWLIDQKYLVMTTYPG